MDISKLLEKAKEAVDRRNYDYAIELLLQGCRMNPDHAQCRRELRLVENRVAKEKTVGMFGKAKIMAKVTQAQGLIAAKKFDSALEVAEDAVKDDPSSISAQMTAGKAAVHANYMNSAAVIFEFIRDAKGGGDNKAHVEASRFLARVYKAQGKINEALSIFTEISRNQKGDREADQELRDLNAMAMSKTIESNTKGTQGGSLARSIAKSNDEVQKLSRDAQEIKSTDELVLAIDDAKKEAASRADDPRVHGKLGDLYRRAEDYANAKIAYDTAISKDPSNWSWKFKVDDLDIWKQSKDLGEILKKFKAGDQSVKDDYTKRRAALLEFRMKSFVEREKQYSTDSRIVFELASIYFDLAEVKRDKVLYDEALKRLQVTYKDPKYRYDSALRMGIAFGRKGQFEIAVKRLDEVLALLELKDNRWKDLMYAKADILEQMNKKPDALVCFKEIYEVDLSFKDVSKRVEALEKLVADSTAGNPAG